MFGKWVTARVGRPWRPSGLRALGCFWQLLGPDWHNFSSVPDRCEMLEGCYGGVQGVGVGMQIRQ